MKKAKKQPRQTLTLVKGAKLYNWIAKHKRIAKTEDPKELAKMASFDLKLEITANQVNGLRKQMGIEVKRGRKSNGADGVNKSVKAALRMLAGELMDTRYGLSLPINSALETLAQ